MLRIAICDDREQARDSLRFALEKLLDEKNEEIVYEFSEGERAARWLSAHPGEVDLLFLDVEMAGLDGMETARKIRNTGSDIIIVFVTGYSQYVFQGYSVGAMDYLMKPVDPARLRELLMRVRNHLCRNESDTFTFKNTDGTYRISCRDICFFYSEKRRIFAVTRDNSYPFYGKLDDLESAMDGNFVRIHQRYLVNAVFVTHIGQESVTLGNIELPISRGLHDKAASELAKAILGGDFI